MGILDQAPAGGEQQSYIPQSPYAEQSYDNSQAADIVMVRLDTSDFLEELRHQLKGEVWSPNKQGGGSYKKIFNTDLTDEGVNDIVHFVSAFGTNKNIFLGCLSPEVIKQRCYSLWVDLARYAFFKQTKSGFTKRNRSLLIKEIVYTIHSGLSRSELGREANQISTLSQRMEHILREDRPQKNALNPLNLLPSFNRR